jgi:hypothetical protein
LKFGRLPERPKGADCKSAGNAYGGSNPSSATQAVARSFPDSWETTGFRHSRAAARAAAPATAQMCDSSVQGGGPSGQILVNEIALISSVFAAHEVPCILCKAMGNHPELAPDSRQTGSPVQSIFLQSCDNSGAILMMPRILFSQVRNLGGKLKNGTFVAA